MEKYNLTCIRCPMGCALRVTADGDEVTVTGNTCPRGADYGRQEVTAPVRTVTSTVPVTGGQIPVVSVKTAGDIPKDKIFDVMKDIRSASVPAPVKIGDVIIRNAGGTGTNVIATKDVAKSIYKTES